METIPYPLTYHRRHTREVPVGDVLIGGQQPIVIQSMLTVPTHDPERCLKEIRALDDVDCKIIRLSLTSGRDLEAMPRLRQQMRDEGINRPLVADVHFSPQLAIDACEVFEKVRINPGNFTDRPKNSRNKNSAAELAEGRELMREALQPLLLNLQKYQRSLRIGVNQGSLSSRMIENFGDSPLGMVESALEVIDLLEEEQFERIVVSLKSSNPAVVLQAYRLLVERLPQVNSVPLHLGVTEAGNGIIGRIKSLAGIGPLLNDGIGDTIRVSLTEECCNEIAYARKILAAMPGGSAVTSAAGTSPAAIRRPFQETRRVCHTITTENLALGGGTPVKIGIEKGAVLPPVSGMDFETDFQYEWNGSYLDGLGKALKTVELTSAAEKISEQAADMVVIKGVCPLTWLRSLSTETEVQLPIAYQVPVPDTDVAETKFLIQLAAALGEGLIDVLLLPDRLTVEYLEKLLCLLQATRTRLLAPDYIACPSCGRTLFDLKSTTARIKEKTSHLKGIKIGIMGCIVNGPGEMADADFGYVGSGKGRVDLYFGKQRVQRGIAENDAVDALIELIKAHHMWMDPPTGKV